MSASSIEWTDATWNPVTGCDRVSPGCAHCYALDYAARLKGMGQAKYQRDGDPKTSGPGFGVNFHIEELDRPLRWRKPRRVFVNSMSDLFHEDVNHLQILSVFATMAVARRHTFQVLTKRPERMRALLTDPSWPSRLEMAVRLGPWADQVDEIPWPLPNVWLGVSIENRRFVHRADLLRQTPAAVRFISAEPLLAPLVSPHHRGGLDLTDIDWLIVGGESGPKARPVKPEWVRDLRDVAQETGAAFFFKQWGGRTPKAGGRELDGRTWDEFPEPGESPATGRRSSDVGSGAHRGRLSDAERGSFPK